MGSEKLKTASTIIPPSLTSNLTTVSHYQTIKQIAFNTLRILLLALLPNRQKTCHVTFVLKSPHWLKIKY